MDVLAIVNSKKLVGVGSLAEDGVATSAVVGNVANGPLGSIEEVQHFADVS